MSLKALLPCVLLTTGMILGLASPVAGAQDFPDKPVRIVVPFAPGGVSDILGRVLADKLSARWNQTVIVENKPGAGGGIGADHVAKSPADGHTLLIADASVATTNPTLYPAAPKEFAAIINVARFGQILVAPSTLPVNNIGELLTQDKQKTSRLNVASSGNGTSNHLVLEKFKAASGTNMTHVPFKGAGQAIGNVAGGQVDLMFTSAPLANPLISSGKLKALAVTTPTRMPGFEQVPTLAESGLPGFEWLSIQGLFAPPGTPQAVLQKINRDVADILRQPDMRERWNKMGLEAIDNTQQEFTAWINAERTSIIKLIQSANIKVE
ncbi:MAG: tripartite tricarboxylate transporter substrate binding protein [Rhodoferax sp.]|nr:tripartite tricarboxylate transporter substrate binding protein [Rhodoferax sp.]